MRFHAYARLIAAAILVVGLQAIACQKKDDRFKPTFKLTGKIMYDGQPPVGASVGLIPADPNQQLDPWARPSAIVGEDGRFEMMTYKAGDGVPAGDYLVVVFWIPPGIDGPLEKINKLPMRYSTREGSPAKVTVGDKPLDIGQIDLTSNKASP